MPWGGALVTALAATTTASVLLAPGSALKFNLDSKLSNHGIINVTGQQSKNANDVTPQYLHDVVDGNAIKDNIDLGLHDSQSVQYRDIAVNNFSVSNVYNSDWTKTYAGKLSASGSINIRYTKIVYMGRPVTETRDYSWNLEFSGFRIWNTRQTVTETNAPADLLRYPLLEAKNHAFDYVKNHFTSYVSDLPSEYRVTDNGVDADTTAKTLKVKTRLSSYISNGSVYGSGIDVNIVFTGFEYNTPTSIDNIMITNFGSDRVYDESMKGDIANRALSLINANKDTYHPAPGSQVRNLTRQPNQAEEAKGVYKFNAGLSPYYGQDGGLKNDEFPFTITATGFKVYNTTTLTTVNSRFNSNAPSINTEDVKPAQIENTILDLIHKNKIFGGEIKDRTAQSITASDITIGIGPRNLKERTAEVDVTLKSQFVWDHGNTTSTGLTAKLTLTDFKKSIASPESASITGNTTVYEGEQTTLTVDTVVDIHNSTSDNFSYAWYWGTDDSGSGTPIADSNKKSINITPTLDNNNWKVWCKVTLNDETIKSSSVTLTVKKNSVKSVSYTASTDVNEGSSITANADVTMTFGTPTYDSNLVFNWYAMNNQSGVKTPIEGAQHTRELNAPAKFDYNGQVLVVGVSYKSEAEVFSTVNKLINVTRNVINTLEITSSTTSVTEEQTISADSSYTMSLTDVPSSDIQYQWFKADHDGSNPQPIDGANQKNISFQAQLSDNTKQLFLKATYNDSTKVSNILYLTVKAKPKPTVSRVTITGNTDNLTNETQLSLDSAIEMSYGPVPPESELTYDWIVKSGSEQQSIANTKNLRVMCNSDWDNKDLFLRVSYNGNTADSDPIRLHIRTIPKITDLKITGSTTAQEGNTINLKSIVATNVTDSSSLSIKYQWYTCNTDGTDAQPLAGKTDKDVSIIADKTLNGKMIYLTATLNSDPPVVSQKLPFTISDRPLATVSTVSFTGKTTGLIENEMLDLKGHTTMSDGTENPDGASYDWKVNLDGRWETIGTSQNLSISANPNWNGKQLVLEVTYNGSTKTSAPSVLQIQEKTKLVAVRITGPTTVELGKQLELSSELIANVGTIPTSSVTYEWFYKEDAVYTKIPDSSTGSLSILADDELNGKSIVLRASFEGVQKESLPVVISVVDKPIVPTPGEGTQNGSAGSWEWLNKEYYGLSLMYWIIIGGSTLLILIIIIIAIAISKAKKNKRKAVAKLGVNGRTAGLIQAPVRPAIAQAKSTGQTIPTKSGVKQATPTANAANQKPVQGQVKPAVGQQTAATMNKGYTPMQGVNQAPRQAAVLKRPGQTQGPSKITVNKDPNQSLAPKKK